MKPNQKSEEEMREVLVRPPQPPTHEARPRSRARGLLSVGRRASRVAQTQKYGKHVRQSQAQREQMSSFLTSMKNHDEEQQRRFDQVLYAGKAKVKRHYAHDAGSDDDQSTIKNAITNAPK